MFRKLISFLPLSGKTGPIKAKIIAFAGFKPGNIGLYVSALTHKSLSNSALSNHGVNNERLEYLGDAILSAVIAEYLYTAYPDCKEGFLTKMRARLVNRNNMNSIALKMGFDKLVSIPENVIPVRKHIYGNALEAFIGAVFVDKGYNICKQFIIKKIINLYPDIEQLEYEDEDFKSMIIQWGQKNRQEVSFESYEVSEPDKPHPTFVAKINIMNMPFGEGLGKSKKEAQQHAAKQALNKLPH